MNLSSTVSVIIPAFNRDDTLLRALQSVLKQTYQNFEILVVDDGSTPPLTRPVPESEDPRIRWIRLEQNMGPGHARNVGLQHSQGEFVAFLDSDDEWLPNKLERQLAAFQGQDQKFQFDAVASGFHIVRHDQGSVAAKISIPQSLRAGSGQIVWGCNISPGSTLVARKSLFAQHGTFREDMRRLEDWEWLIRVVADRNLFVVPEPLAIVHFSAPPDYTHVVDGCNKIDALQRKNMLDQSWFWYLKFRSTLELEKASAAIGAGKVSAAIRFGLACLAFWPFRNLLFWSRVFRYLTAQPIRPR